jgi:ankyrin repeat protein
VCVRVWCDGLVWAPVRWVQEDGTTALMIASHNGHVGVVRALLARGADVTAAHVSQSQAVGSGQGCFV